MGERRRSRSASSGSSNSDEGQVSRRRGRPSHRKRAGSRSGSDLSRASSVASLLRGASGSEDDAMEEAAGLVGASNATAMALVGTEGINSAAPPDHTSLRAASMSADSESEYDSDVEPPPRQPNAPSGKEGGAVATLLQQLAREPIETVECAAKFSLYEGYASEVENMRNTLFKFHEESCPTLPSTIVTEMNRQIHGIDCAESMGIPDRSREWFVFHMMRQAERNNMKMASILDAFDKKLKFLAQDDQLECPVCLDSFDNDAKAAETLGCCHKVCKECWHNWARVMHGRPFCPFCRHEEFMGVVAGRADTAHESDSGSDGD